MKTLIKISIVTLTILIVFALFNFASAIFTKTTRLPEGSSTYLIGNDVSSVIDSEHLTIVKFTDGKTDCYTVITKVQERPVNTAISCLK